MNTLRKPTLCIFFLLIFFVCNSLKADEPSLFHRVQEVYDHYVVLEDGSEWDISWFYQSNLKDWQPGDQVRITYHSYWRNNICLKNLNTETVSWGVIRALPSFEKSCAISHIDQFSLGKTRLDLLVLLDNENTYRIFRRPSSWYSSPGWLIDDHIFVYDNGVLLNLDRAEMLSGWVLTTLEECQENQGSAHQHVLNLEKRLNQKVIAQTEATHAVASTFMNYYAGLRDPTKPIHVFLFLGPTGVGKTELAKVLSNELNRELIRVDMSQFPSRHDHWKLVGSGNGYYDREKGGELTNAIEAYPKSLVLLDEVEKGAPEILKTFLPVFDDGYIRNGRSKLLSCTEIVFIMTSNLCSSEIVDLFNKGYEPDEILREIEPKLISTLSPEFYNRVDPIVFCQLSPETIRQLVNLMMDDLVKTMKSSKNVTLVIDESTRDYLSTAGYHPTLGARPLKRLIQQRITSAISLALLKSPRQIAKKMVVSYQSSTDEIVISWSL